MLKKLLGLAVVVCLMAALAACGHSQAAANPREDGPEETAMTTTSATASGTKKKPTATTTKKPTATTAEEETTVDTTKKPTAAAATTTAAKKETVVTTVVTAGPTTTTTTEPTTITTTAYVPRPKNPATLSAEREREIKEDYIAWQISSSPNAYLHFQNLTLDDIYIEKYLGTYNDSVALFITAKGQGYQDVVSQGTLAGFLFKFGSSQRLYIHKNSMFVDLFEAYHSGLITEHDVGDIWWYYQHEGHSYGDIN